MVTGASTADVALILLDARKGITEQSRRHAFLATLLGVPHIVVCVNKMDLVDSSEARFEAIRDEFGEFATRLRVPRPDVHPDLGAAGRQRRDPLGEHALVRRAPLLLATSSASTSPPTATSSTSGSRSSTWSGRSSKEVLDYRGYAGTVASGVLKPGDRVRALPSGLESTIASIETADGEVDEAFPPMAVTITLADDIDTQPRRHALPAAQHAARSPRTSTPRCAGWTRPRRWPSGASTRSSTRRAGRGRWSKAIDYRIDVNTLHRDETATELSLNEIGRIQLRATQPLFVDPYVQNRQTGAFILVDEASNKTVAAGMIGRLPG